MRILHRVGVAAAAVTALGATFAAGAVWNSPHRPDRVEAADRHPARIQPVDATIRPAADCDDLLHHYIDANIDQVGPYGWGLGGPIRYGEFGEFGDKVVPPMASSPEASGAGVAADAPTTSGSLGMRAATASRTGTNVQERGVDEPDTVKTDGHLLLRLSDHRLAVYDVSGATPRRLGSVDIDRRLTDPELVLVGQRAVVTGMHFDAYDTSATSTHQVVVDLHDPTAPQVVDQRAYSAATVSVRQHGPVVREVLTSGLPSLDFVQPSDQLTTQEATKKNKELVRSSTISDWLPTVTVGSGAPRALVDCADVSIPAEGNPAGGLWIVGLDPAAPDTASTSGLAAATTLAYESPDRLYVATSPMSFGWCCVEPMPVGPMTDGMAQSALPDEPGTTDLFAFALDGTAASYVASGTVDGAIADRWSMDSVDGVLRVALGPTPATGNFNAIVTLGEKGGDLVELGHLYKLGVDEQIQSMRWFGKLAVMVTYRQVDPFYAIDLSDPAHPRLLGRLKVPGYSSYLHPIGPMRFLAMGQLGGRAQAAVYRVDDVAHPRQTTRLTYAPGTTADAGTDPRQFTWLPDKRVALTVISRGWNGRTGWVSVLTLQRGHLSNRMVEADYGYDVADIRTVELPDGRVVLVTDDGVRFLRV